MDYNLIATIATTALMVATAALGAKYRRLKGKAEKPRDLVDGLVRAWEDDVLTAEEAESLAKRAKALLEPEEESP